MYAAIKIVHSYWAYLVVLILLLGAFNALIKYFSKKPYEAKDFRISLFTLIVSHIQLLIGLVLYFVSPYFSAFSEQGMGEIMKDSNLRLYLVEHPSIMIISIVLITMGYSKHKKKLSSTPKFKILAIFYTLALILMLSRIPWSAWLN
jgi:heme/copper-type cytochrome/quinol oxidase subunit 2